MKNPNTKLKILYLMKIFYELTDESHCLTIKQIIAELERYSISAERKSLYDDIEALRSFGMDIISKKEKNFGYYLASRDFEVAELKLLADSVAASKFITEKKSNELIKKLGSFSSKYEAQKLNRQVYVVNRVKAHNEKIYYSVDAIHAAIANNKQITFKYYEYTRDKQKQFRKNGEFYKTTPMALSYDSDNYYLISYSKKHDSLVHYRVDKMEQVQICEEIGEKSGRNFDLSSYSKMMFSMFSGEEHTVKVQFDDSLANVVIDRFGQDVKIECREDGTFIARLNAAISPTFYAYIFQFGTKAKIISPSPVAEEFKKFTKKILGAYND